jgi:hypothetical protein
MTKSINASTLKRPRVLMMHDRGSTEAKNKANRHEAKTLHGRETCEGRLEYSVRLARFAVLEEVGLAIGLFSGQAETVVIHSLHMNNLTT